MTEPPNELLWFLVISSLYVLVLGTVVAILLRLLRLSGAPACRLLLVVVVAPLVAFVGLSLPIDVGMNVPVEVPSTLKTGPVERPPVAGPSIAGPSAEESTVAADAVNETGTETGIRPGRAIRLSLAQALVLLWSGIALLLSIRIGIGLVGLKRTLSRARTDPPSRVLRLVARIARESGLRRPPRLALLEGDFPPFAAGVFRHTVGVPTRLAEPGQEEELRFVLLHEFAHLRRRHAFWIAPHLLLRTVYFFHPLLRWALHRIEEEREILCDADVTRAAGRRAPYASFLLSEVERAAGRTWNPLPALRRGTVARRVHRILHEGSSGMKTKLGATLSFAGVVLALVALLLAGPVPAAAKEGQADRPPELDLDHINASPTDKAGAYHVMPVFEKIEMVKVIKRGGPYGPDHTRELVKGSEWKFKGKKGRLKVKVPIDDEKEMIIVYGRQVVPWEWQTREPLEKVRVLLGDRPGVEGEDYSVDLAAGRIRFLKKGLCKKKLHYYISYDFPADPAKPNTGRGGAIGNHSDRKAIRRFEGIDEGGASKPAAGTKLDTVGTNASATDDPRAFTLVRAMKTDGMRVAVAKLGKPGDLQWLEPGEGYIYNERKARIRLVGDLRIDGKKQYLFVHGTPARRNVFFLHRAVEKGEVEVTIEGKALVEGKGFRVDLENGRVTVNDERILERGTKFRVSAGSFTFGN